MSAAVTQRGLTKTFGTRLLDRAVNHAKAGARPAAAQPEVLSQSIVVALDGSWLSLAAPGPAEQVARCVQLPLVLVQAVRPAQNPHLDAQLNEEQGETDAMKVLHAAAEDAGATGLAVSEVVVKRPLADNPAAAILQTAGAFNAKMIVMAAHGRTGILRALHGSGAEQGSHGTDVPVLLVRTQHLRLDQQD